MVAGPSRSFENFLGGFSTGLRVFEKLNKKKFVTQSVVYLALIALCLCIMSWELHVSGVC